MKSVETPRGLVVDLFTPLTIDGGIDGMGLGRLLDRVSPYCQGIFLAGPAGGEGLNLNSEIRSELLHKTMAVIKGRQPIFVWVTQPSEEETWKTIEKIQTILAKREKSVDVYMVDCPLFYHSNRGLPPHYMRICDSIGIPIILHNEPGLIRNSKKPFKRANIRTSILKELIAIPCMSGMIFSGTLDRAHNYQKACRAKPTFKIYDGEEIRFLNHPSRHGCLSIGANLAPEAWQIITNASLNLNVGKEKYPRNLQQVWKVGGFLRSLKELYDPMPVAIIKRSLYEMGIIKTPRCTFPVTNVEDAQKGILELMPLFDSI